MRNFNLTALPATAPILHPFYQGDKPYQSYLPEENLVPAFLPVGNERRQVRITSSTHNPLGILQNSSPEALANTERLQAKLEKNLADYTFYELEEDEDANIIVFSYGITAQAAREAVTMLRSQGKAVSLLIAKTLFPIPSQYMEILQGY